MTLPQARGRDTECERAAEEALLEVAESFSPRVEDAGEGVVFVELDGHARLAHPPAVVGAALAAARLNGAGASPAPTPAPMSPIVDAARDLGRDMIRAAEKAGLPARAGIAASKLSARVAAGLPESPTVVPEGEEAHFLAPLPLEKLAPQLEIAATLDRWGLSTIGELAKLPEGEVASRLGEIGRALHMAARGIDSSPLEPWVPPASFTEGMDLEWPLASLEPVLFLAHAALERLSAPRVARPLLHAPRRRAEARPRRPRRPLDRPARAHPRREDAPHPHPPRARGPPSRRSRRGLLLLRASRLPAAR